MLADRLSGGADEAVAEMFLGIESPRGRSDGCGWPWQANTGSWASAIVYSSKETRIRPSFNSTPNR